MILVEDIFNGVNDRINSEGNGLLTNDKFNRYARLGELALLDWLSGDVSNVIPPQPYLSQKNKDWLSPFITKHEESAVGGKVSKPEDYYLWENGYLLGGYSDLQPECDEESEDANAGCNIVITLVDGEKFNKRCVSKIKGLKPSFTKPICKEISDGFEFAPSDIGSVTIEYIRYPVAAFRAVKIDPIYNDEVYDESKSKNFEWPEFAKGILIWFIVDLFSNSTREKALKEFNLATGKTTRG